MKTSRQRESGVVLHASIALPHTLLQAVTENGLGMAITTNLRDRLSALASTMGVPGEVVVELSTVTPLVAAASQPGWPTVRLNHGRSCRYPPESLTFARAYASGRYPNSEWRAADIELWLLNAVRATSTRLRDQFTTFLSVIVLESISLQPSCLWGASQHAAYVDALRAAQPENVCLERGQEELARIFRSVLDLRISLADLPAVSAALERTSTRDSMTVVEELVACLRPNVLAIRLSPLLFTLAKATQPDPLAELLAFVRKELVEERGVLYPEFSLLEDSSLQGRSFAFTLNHLTTLPVVALSPRHLLINDSAERIRSLHELDTIPTTNPSTWQPGGIISAEQRGLLTERGYTAWDSWAALVLSLADTLRLNGACFVHRPMIERQLQICKEAFPTLTECVRARFDDEELTSVLRGLVRSGAPIRDFQLLLERFLDWDYRAHASARVLVLDDRPSLSGKLAQECEPRAEQLVTFMRAGLKRQLSHELARGMSTVVVYLLHEDLEAALERYDGGGEEVEHVRILGAIDSELAYLPRTARTPTILTSRRAAASLRELARPEKPRLTIASFQELASEVNVQPVARIAYTS